MVFLFLSKKNIIKHNSSLLKSSVLTVMLILMLTSEIVKEVAMSINGFEILYSLALLSTVTTLLINDFDETTKSKRLLGSRVVVGG